MARCIYNSNYYQESVTKLDMLGDWWIQNVSVFIFYGGVIYNKGKGKPN